LAVPAFLPVTVSTGYVAAFATNLYNFRQRSLVERIFWSIPLSLAVSTISAVLIGKFISLGAFVAVLWATTAVCLVLLTREALKVRRAAQKWNIGWRPLGGSAFAMAIAWVLLVILSLVDININDGLFMNVALLDQSARINWTESILHTGIPPANPLYMFGHPAQMRNYYFWYVICAAVAKMAHLPVRAVIDSSCVWAGFLFASLTGLYLKHFLAAGRRLRQQFLRAMALLMVTGLDICVVIWIVFYLHRPPIVDLESWSKGAVISWLDTLLWSPNHVAGLVCCMFALLLAWMARDEDKRRRTASVILIAAALASAFGLSVFVTFAFFIVMLAWAIWQVTIEHELRPALFLATGGVGAAVLLIPYFSELTHGSSGLQGGSLFAFSIREMIPPGDLLATPWFQHMASSHPVAAVNLAKIVLLVPGYTIELGFYLAVLLIYLIPAWRGRIPLNSAQRSLVFICVATLPLISLLRSGVLKTNDFGWRGALLLQFPLLLMASELTMSWKLADHKKSAHADGHGLPGPTPALLRSIAGFALVIGVLGTVYQVLMMRFFLPVVEASLRVEHNPTAGEIPHNAYISSVGYARLDADIPDRSVVQFNPNARYDLWAVADWLGVGHQVAIVSDKGSCGSELGGDPRGCPEMAAAIDALYNDGTAEQARSTCHQYGIQYLIARIYDPPWHDKTSWVWTLKPVVSDKEFRALDCTQ
jgi:hypothetical protein